jgi:glucan biosynthesis protein
VISSPFCGGGGGGWGLLDQQSSDVDVVLGAFYFKGIVQRDSTGLEARLE